MSHRSKLTLASQKWWRLCNKWLYFLFSDQNRNKTKKESKEKAKPPETVLAEVHTREVQRLEALCEARTKQLNMVKLQLQNSNLAFDGMSVTVNYLANQVCQHQDRSLPDNYTSVRIWNDFLRSRKSFIAVWWWILQVTLYIYINQQQRNTSFHVWLS